MCGIVGLFLKKDDLRPKLGDMLTDMLITMTDRGPDSAGIAIYGDEAVGSTKITNTVYQGGTGWATVGRSGYRKCEIMSR